MELDQLPLLSLGGGPSGLAGDSLLLAMDMQGTGEPGAGTVRVFLEASSAKNPGHNGCVTLCFFFICREGLRFVIFLWRQLNCAARGRWLMR